MPQEKVYQTKKDSNTKISHDGMCTDVALLLKDIGEGAANVTGINIVSLHMIAGKVRITLSDPIPQDLDQYNLDLAN